MKLDSLIERGFFSLASSSEAQSHRIFGAHFMENTKNARMPIAFNKSRLVAQAFNDKRHGLLTHAPTVLHSFVHFLNCLCALDNYLEFFTRDIFQA